MLFNMSSPCVEFTTAMNAAEQVALDNMHIQQIIESQWQDQQMPEGLLESSAENLTTRDLSDSDIASIARKLLANYGTAKLSVPGGLLSGECTGEMFHTHPWHLFDLDLTTAPFQEATSGCAIKMLHEADK